MKIALDLIRRLGAQLMLVALLALALQTGAASAAGLGGLHDCQGEAHASQLVEPHHKAGHTHHGAPCESACCSAVCCGALLDVAATIPLPAMRRIVHGLPGLDGTEGIDLEGLARPPKAGLPV